MQKLQKIKPTTRGRELEKYKRQLVLTQRQREIAIGVLLGDASLNTQNKGETYRLKFEQSIRHSVYINHLHSEFDSWCLSGPVDKTRTNANKNTVETKEFQTVAHISLNEFADLFLNDQGKKVIKPNLVRDHVTELSLAYWFMDDGGKLDYTSNQGKGLLLHTQGFNEQEVIELAEGLAIKFNLQTKAKKTKGKYVVSISGNSFDEFMKLTESHIIMPMKYKLPTPRKVKKVDDIV